VADAISTQGNGSAIEERAGRPHGDLPTPGHVIANVRQRLNQFIGVQFNVSSLHCSNSAYSSSVSNSAIRRVNTGCSMNVII